MLGGFKISFYEQATQQSQHLIEQQNTDVSNADVTKPGIKKKTQTKKTPSCHPQIWSIVILQCLT